MTSGKEHKFSYGKKLYDIFHYARLGIIFKGTLDLISIVPGIEKKKVFNIIDEIQLKIGIGVLNDYIIRDDELIRYRIERVLNDSIKRYENNKI
jgi:hypothetical protein